MTFKTRNVCLATFPDALFLDIAGPMQVFSSANKVLKRKAYNLGLASMDGGPVRTDTGVELICSTRLEDVLPGGDLLIPGGPGVDQAIADIDFIYELKRLFGSCQRVISTCSVSLLLAATGILNGKLATCHWSKSSQAPSRYPEVNWDMDRIYTKDGNVYTSAGVSTGIDLCLSIVEEDHGRTVALTVARSLVLFMQRTGNQSQYSHPLRVQNASSSRIEVLCSMIVSDPGKSWRLSDMSAITNMTERTLHRHFVGELKESPSQFVERIRVDHARAMIDGGHRSMKRIAELSGFKSEQNLRRAFIGNLNLTPVEYRKRFGAIA